MPLFWFVAGMLTAAALLCVLLPWLRSIPRLGGLPILPWYVPLLGLVVIGAAVGLYRWFGDPSFASSGITRSSQPGLDSATSTDPDMHSGKAGSMESALETLQSRLTKGGGTPQDWDLLAKTYEYLGRTEEAAQARAHALPKSAASAEPGESNAETGVSPITPESRKLLAQATRARSDKKFAAAAAIYSQLAAQNQMNADSWADYADASASAAGGKLAGLPETYIAKALAQNPRQAKALWLKASADEEQGRSQAAMDDWRRLLAVLPADSQDSSIVAANLQHDSQLAVSAPGAAAAPTVSGEVSLSSALSARAIAGATLFIVAKSVDSPGAPVAVYRSTVGQWPVKFQLDDSQSMLPGRTLSNAGRITVEARISPSGQALPASGDLRGKSGVLSPADRGALKIVIDEVIS